MDIQLTKQEIWWRKAWLWLLMLNPLIHFFLNPWQLELTNFVGLCGGLIFAYIFYCCAYRKPGTRLLTFSLVVITISLLSDIVLALTSRFISETGALSLVCVIFWLILCYQLRRINRKLQIQRFLASEDYVRAIALLRSATTLEDLEVKFKVALCKQPRHCTAAVSGEYLAKKSALLGEESPG
jgi:hypothetical protein